MAIGARSSRGSVVGFVECDEDIEEQKSLEEKKSWSSVTLSNGELQWGLAVTPLGKQLRASRSVNQ